MNVLSLFDGMSCGQIALERAGIKVDNYYASEIDKYAMQVTMKNYPNTIQLGDVTKWSEWDLPNIDLLIGGSPCQGFSFAGKQLNFDDPRSKLFFEFVKVLNELKPKYFMLENVNMKKEYQDIISECLGVKPIVINSKLITAQLRNRLYWTNIPNVSAPEEKGIILNDILEDAFSDREKSYCIDANYGKGSNLRRYFYRGSRQIVFTDKDFLETLVNDLPGIEKMNEIGRGNRSKWRFLNFKECERLQTVPEGYTEGIPNFYRYQVLGNGWTVDVIAHILKGVK